MALSALLMRSRKPRPRPSGRGRGYPGSLPGKGPGSPRAGLDLRSSQRASSGDAKIARVLLLAASLFALAPLTIDAALAHRPKALTARQEKAIADEIKAFRAKVAETIAKKDAAAIAALYADRFVHTHASGKVDGKQARVAAVLAGEPVIETAPATDLAFHAPAGWTAVITGLSQLPADGKTHSFRWTAVYVRGPDGWQIAASHATRVAETS